MKNEYNIIRNIYLMIYYFIINLWSNYKINN
jgi:hypothetical protein